VTFAGMLATVHRLSFNAREAVVMIALLLLAFAVGALSICDVA
jgi:hypothetical protein